MQNFDHAMSKNAPNIMFKTGINFNILNWEFSCVEKLSENHEFIPIKKIRGMR